MDPGSGMLLEDFGQRVDLTRRIREVLANYPEGTTALRELIQNADDAGASRVRLCLDRRSHGAASLLAPALAQWQGPALLAYNDAVFTDEDFASISRIGDSRKVAQTWKTGRFGVGFNSVYHLTDLPSFVSGKYVVVFDPQGAYLPNVSSANPGKRIDYDTILRQGHAFCFLPLPVRTGLSVHVNGYFEVSSNRRDIWYGADMDRGGKLRSDWNREIEGGTWISPVDALLHDEGFSRGNDLNEALVLLGMPVVRLPKMIVDMLSKFYKKSMLKIFGIFSESSQGNHYYVCDDMEYELLSGVGDRVVDRNIPTILLDKLHQLASNSQANITLINGPIFVKALPQRITPGERNELYQFLLDAKWVFNGGSPSSYGFSDLSNSRKYLPPLGVPDYLLNADFIFCICTSDEDIIMRYYAVERMPKSIFYRRKLIQGGKVLLSYLEVHALKWYVNKPSDGWKKVNMLAKVTTALRSRDKSCEFDLEKFWSDLRMICWCPVLVTAPSPALPWPSVSSMIAPPKQVRMQEDMWIVSASSRILDGECNSSALSYSLGWSSSPSGSVIAAQLLELGKNNEIVTDQVLRQELALVMPKIYSLLANLIGSDEMDIVKVVLEGCRWIWVGMDSQKLMKLFLSGHLHLAPYIRVVPVDLAVFKDLFLELGIKEHLHPVDYATSF
ncbi:hypothetical protein PR202_gb13945 [Eleusine coracana subsp. coracana]|uniref:Sacsin/Nov domain-containing protein n=1 Tax=Eleusine coracana subsp. coracana TaxID=191504 RepID=A0AAV5EUH7_ELECO|nr:hypothetical protein PR202_gb13945 [Eleusine coracana subsp. coracana]